MNNQFKEAIWSQFGASIDMLINVILNCPDDYFSSRKRFYYMAYHSTIFLDYYLTLPPSDFIPVLPFTQTNDDEKPTEAIDDLIPNKIYTKQELIAYLELSRAKCKNIIESLTDDNNLSKRFVEGNEESDMNYSLPEILLYNLRHTQHHIAQLNMLIRQDLDKHMEWSFRAGDIKQ
jgi:hypothetical protein